MSWSDIINTHFRRADQEVTIKELCFNNHIATESAKKKILFITISVFSGYELYSLKEKKKETKFEPRPLSKL